MDILEVDDIHVKIQEAYILQGISFNVSEGEVVVILGKNGAGKTTTLESIMGISSPNRGSIYVEDEDVTGLTPHEIAKKGLGYVPDTSRVFGDLTVEENLRMGTIKGDIEDRYMEDVIDLFPFLENYMSQKGKALSGGEQKMLSLARIMVYKKNKLILVDEPTEGLSPENTEKTINALRDVKKRSSVLLVTGNFSIAKDLGDRYVMMSNGQVVERGDMDELSRKSETVKKYLGAKPRSWGK